jgi:hypothetical protein
VSKKKRPNDARPSVNISIDVPKLDDGLAFYESVFGFVESARPFPTMAVLDANNVTVCMSRADRVLDENLPLSRREPHLACC